MNNFIDLTGHRYGCFEVVVRGSNRCGKITHWYCVCDCGTIKSVAGTKLRSGKTRSCGCLQRLISKDTQTTHGHSHTRLYKIWIGMKERCKNKADIHHKYWGGRGIRVCEEWRSFKPFMEWAQKNGYSDELSIDRIDCDGNYTPDNCRWATTSAQERNRRASHHHRPAILTDPDGDEVIIAAGMVRQFCRENNLSQGLLAGVLRGEHSQHKKWLGKYL